MACTGSIWAYHAIFAICGHPCPRHTEANTSSCELKFSQRATVVRKFQSNHILAPQGWGGCRHCDSAQKGGKKRTKNSSKTRFLGSFSRPRRRTRPRCTEPLPWILKLKKNLRSRQEQKHQNSTFLEGWRGGGRQGCPKHGTWEVVQKHHFQNSTCLGGPKS